MSARNPGVARAIRQAIGYPAPTGSLTRLAEAVGTTPSTASRWHSLQSSPDPALWSIIEHVLELPTGSLTKAARNPVTELDADILDRLERVEHAIVLLAHQLEESLDREGELRQLLADLETERVVQRRRIR